MPPPGPSGTPTGMQGQNPNGPPKSWPESKSFGCKVKEVHHQIGISNYNCSWNFETKFSFTGYHISCTAVLRLNCSEYLMLRSLATMEHFSSIKVKNSIVI